MNAEIVPLFMRNVAPAQDATILEEAIAEAIEAFGEQRFALSLVEEQARDERRAA